MTDQRSPRSEVGILRYAIDNVDWDDPLSYVREMYHVPAYVGRRVVTHAGEGEITGGDGQYLLVRIDGRLIDDRFHPTWRMQYRDQAVSA